jgi:hypothetical protein
MKAKHPGVLISLTEQSSRPLQESLLVGDYDLCARCFRTADTSSSNTSDLFAEDVRDGRVVALPIREKATVAVRSQAAAGRLRNARDEAFCRIRAQGGAGATCSQARRVSIDMKSGVLIIRSGMGARYGGLAPSFPHERYKRSAGSPALTIGRMNKCQFQLPHWP